MTSSAVWAERYESLRRYVLEGRSLFQTQPLGLALWLAQGMASWMRQWSQVIEATPPPRAAALPRGPSAGPWQQQLTRLLAQMTLAHLQPQVSL